MPDFKHFLKFTDRGARARAEAFAPTGGDVESPFEAALLASLRAKGWTVLTQIGASGFRIDLGIVHPDAPGRYLAGVECDGATYHSSATARDRGRLREHVLTDLGWRIRRVWSTEWWMDAEGALAKLDQRLREDLDDDRGRAAEAIPAEAPAEPSVSDPAGIEPTEGQLPKFIEEFQPEPVNDPEPAPDSEPHRLYADWVTQPAVGTTKSEPPREERGYRTADLSSLGVPIEPERFYDGGYRTVLAAMVAHVLTVKGPIYEDLLVRRITRAHGMQRAGHLIRVAVLDQVDPAVARTDDDGRTVLWPPGEASTNRPASPVRTERVRPRRDTAGGTRRPRPNSAPRRVGGRARQVDGPKPRPVPDRGIGAGSVRARQ